MSNFISNPFFSSSKPGCGGVYLRKRGCVVWCMDSYLGTLARVLQRLEARLSGLGDGDRISAFDGLMAVVRAYQGLVSAGNRLSYEIHYKPEDMREGNMMTRSSHDGDLAISVKSLTGYQYVVDIKYAEDDAEFPYRILVRNPRYNTEDPLYYQHKPGQKRRIMDDAYWEETIEIDSVPKLLEWLEDFYSSRRRTHYRPQ